MNIQIVSKKQQAQGAFNGGEIIENKPIGFPREGGALRPYSNLFYWAHARALTDSTIGLHPHQGFEICSFILKGNIRHYDTQLKDWRDLSAGDVQIIRAGSGISHAEFMARGSEMFQIWFDPNLQRTLSQPASYNDYRAADFPTVTLGKNTVRTLVGAGSPFRMETSDVEVWDIHLHEDWEMNVAPDKIYNFYLIEGQASVEHQPLQGSDFIKITGSSGEALRFTVATAAHLFVLACPVHVSYRTYAIQ